jgi:hypothetical protein
MRKLLPFGFLVVSMVWVSYSAKAQSTPGIVRIERMESGEAVCALVQDDGGYRLEKLFQAKTEMYTGFLDSTAVGQLHSLLANEQLVKLSQQDIRDPLISDSFEHLQLDIWRGQAWQELLFTAPASRKPFKESLDPLMRWFQDLQKRRPAAVRVAGLPTRCQPLPAVSLSVTRTVSEDPNQYLFREESTHSYRSVVDRTCTVVFGDGNYHLERSSQTRGADRQDKVLSGRVELEAIQKLKILLSSPELAASPSVRDVGDERPAGERTTTVVSIPRQSEVQNLVFSSTFNTRNNQREVGGLSNLQNHVANPKLIDPLLDWMKLYTEPHTGATELDGAGNGCSSTSATESVKTKLP